MVIAGLDLSKNHFGMVLKDTRDGRIGMAIGWHSEKWVTEWNKTIADEVYSYHIPERPSGRSIEAHNIETGILLRDIIKNEIVRWAGYTPILLALEGYAYAAEAFNTIMIAEVTSLVKAELYRLGHSIRIHDPNTVKMWAGNGAAKKDEMITYASRKITIPPSLGTLKDNPVGDVADAFFLMDMLDWEIKIRRNPTLMLQLSEKQLQVVNRVTRFYPENLLNRPFTAKRQPVLRSAVKKVVRRDDRVG